MLLLNKFDLTWHHSYIFHWRIPKSILRDRVQVEGNEDEDDDAMETDEDDGVNTDEDGWGLPFNPPRPQDPDWWWIGRRRH